MLPLILAVAIGSYGIACAGWGDMVDPIVACSTAGALAILKAFIAAPEFRQLIANQAD